MLTAIVVSGDCLYFECVVGNYCVWKNN